MSRRFDRHYPGQGVLRDPGRGITFDWGPTVPSDGAIGFAPGCIFMDIDAAGAAAIYINVGTAASADFNVLNGGIDLATLTATAAELNTLHTQTLSTPAAAGFTGGTGTIYKNSVQLSGNIYYTTILVDLTGLGSSTTDLDIIGQGAAAAAHIGQISSQCGTVIDAIRMTCLEAPATGVTDIDLYSANEGTGKFDDGVASTLTETALITAGGAWSNGTTKGATTVPPLNDYLYIVNGAGGTVGTYTAGKFLIELFGH